MLPAFALKAVIGAGIVGIDLGIHRDMVPDHAHITG